ncbi:MAG TPA: response regulator [Nitrososphaeraceae archaeon]|jgi:DNA-binding NtrC family response regulator|nr:response regulator [Nitrososphaeraceae archaeon]
MAAAKAIVIIDDEADLVDLFQEILESDGFKVCTFIDPIQAYNHIQKNPNDYDLILSDYRMPVMNGNELCTKLMRINSEFKVILMSAYENIEDDISRFKFMRKPTTITNLLQIVKNTIAEKANTNI